jgi:hypothetical protein
VCVHEVIGVLAMWISNHIKIILIAGVPLSQALPGFLITAPLSVCVPEVIGVLVVWISHPKKKKEDKKYNIRVASCLGMPRRVV